MADAFPISGSIDPKAFPFLLMDLHRQGATGSLKVEGPSYQKALYFRNGRILFGSSNDPRDQLGAILIESGRITPEQLEDVNAKVGPGSPLAKVLADTGFVSQRELSEAARAKVERILSDVMTYTSGTFEFEDGVLPKGAVDLKLSTETLVLTAVGRVTDRNFVLRHIEGLDTVLTPTRELPERLSQIEAEAGGLPQHLDGRRSLKDAAARTRLDEFEAAKVACALRFMGLVQRSHGAPAAPQRQYDSPPPGLLDLGATAATAIASAAPAPPVAPPAVVFPPEDDATSEAPTVAIPVTPPIVPAPLPKPVWTPPPKPATVPKPAAYTDSGAFPSSPPTAQASTRPSKEDLAALDALLNPRNLEGPLTPLEKPAGQERWVPQFGHRPGQARRAGGSRRGPAAMAGLLVFALAAAGGWYMLNRPDPGTPPGRSPRPPATQAALPSTAPSLEAPPVAPTTTLAAVIPPVVPITVPSPASARSPQAETAAPPRNPPTGGLAAARAALRAGNNDEAARTFAASLRGAAPGTSSIQLLIACSGETVQKAMQAVSADDLFIVPTNFKGRECYRLCWGIYPSADRAGSAIRSLPEYFRKGGATPRVVSAGEILP
jgi:hypothetical protein